MESPGNSRKQPFLSQGEQPGSMPNSPSAIDKSASQYERKLARQRQLEEMEAAASGVGTSMQLDTVGGISEDSGLRSRNETARRFLNDEDEPDLSKKPRAPSSPTKTTANNTVSSLFGGRNDVLAPTGGLNLMDHTTGVYHEPTRGERLLNTVRAWFLGGSSKEYDASAADNDFGGMDYSYNQSDSKYRGTSYLTAIWQDRRKRSIVYIIVAVLVFFTSLATLKQAVFPSARVVRQHNNQRFSDGMDLIIRQGISHAEAFTNYDSPQYHALRWVSYSDPALMPIDDPAFVHRYVLAVFFYGCFLSFEKQAGKQKPIEDGVRQWEGVPNPGWTRHDHWLTGSGVCQWYGVHCLPRNATNPKTGDHKIFTQYDDNEAPHGIIMRQNHVVGMIPQEFKALDELLDVDLSANKLSGTVPSHIGRLYNLKYFHISNNQLKGSLPSEIGGMESLKRLDMRHNLLSGSLPTELGRLYQLNRLELDHNAFTGVVPDMTECHNLTAIHLENNKLDGMFSFSLALQTSLTELHLHTNSIKGTIPGEIESIRHLQVLRLERNELSGQLPFGMFHKMSSLKEVMIQNNNLTGTFPTDPAAMAHLEVLALNDNGIGGTIAKEWGDVVSLRKLHLKNNKLTGSIPESLGNLYDLEDLWLEQNELTGHLPYTLGKCAKLANLFVEDNKLDGGVPTELGQLTALESIRLHGNSIGGEVPYEICDLKSDHLLKFIATDCKESITCECCDSCH